ncbi:serine/threonine-protein kinase dst1-like isoform X1 [Haliotis rufescens]|uniref:serine/threonine-protein kinase dst1-like isoform X1 n=1 Tax=Haliotis rufescens TaxID=6454 RepID=UPI00201F2A63|nr:serine/threonine-protein kinase dst1-like isoform X1 [Haliotis rufescens]
MADCLSETSTHNAIEFSRNSTLVVYRCRYQFYLASGDLVRMCRNGTWTGSEPSCLVDSVLPKQLLVLLIVGVTVTLFALCIPLDFYRFRKRKRECREKQQRINMMVRIQPFHAKMMGAQASSTDEEDPPPSRSFGLGSLLAFFRLVRNKRNRTKKTTPSETPTEEEVKMNTPSSTNSQPVLKRKEESPVLKPPLQPILETNQKKKTSHDASSTSTDRFGNELPTFPRAKSLGSGVGKAVSKPVTPRSATFTDSRSFLTEQKKNHVSGKGNNSSKGDNSCQAAESVDERGDDIVGVERSNTRHPATRPSKSLVFNNRYTVTTRDSDSAISPCKPLPSVGSSPSHAPLCAVNMGF